LDLVCDDDHVWTGEQLSQLSHLTHLSLDAHIWSDKRRATG
jgi:hypothetical protein